MARDRDRKERAAGVPAITPGAARDNKSDSAAPGDGSVTIPLGRNDHTRDRGDRSAALEGDKMQAVVGGGPVKEHEYADKGS
jgi:hypothetical protein